MNGSGPGPENAVFCETWPRLPTALDHFEEWIKQHPHCRLIVVDCLQKIRPKGSRYEGLYAADYTDVGDLQQLASRYGCAVVLVHHLRKSEALDDYDTVSGTAGLTGAADTLMILKRRDRSKMQGLLKISGRDISDREYALTWDENTGLWSYEGSANEFEGRQSRKAIIAAMAQIGRPCSPKEIGDLCDRSRQAVNRHIPLLLKDGVIEKSVSGLGKYRLTPEFQRCDEPDSPAPDTPDDGEYPESWDVP
jgi:biotin operon repressor